MSEARAEGATPAAAPETPGAAVPEPTPAVAESAPAETPATPEAPATPAAPEPPPSLLGAEAPAEPAEGSDAAPAAEPPAPTYEPFTFPEGIEAEPERLAAFTALAGEHRLTQEAAQKLVDLYVADRQALLDALPQQWQNTFNETRQGWVQDTETRFGNRRDTVLNAARSALRLAATNETHLAKMWEVLAFTGAGDHPDIIEGWANINRLLAERRAPPQPDAPPRRNGAGPRPEDARYPNMQARNP